jgi:phosphopantothenoylcysteine decarboxylase / phosphopantothenate---cysteine ligase
MWEHPAVVDNIARLQARGVHLVPPGTGRLAGGDVGAGRLAEPADIVAAAARLLSAGADLAGVRAVVTAGGTREPIDPVRYIGNRSSGKQGYALAAELAGRGARVTLVSTVGLPAPPAVDVVAVETAAEMERAVNEHAGASDVIVMAAAVADFRPKGVAARKIKKADGAPDIVLEPTPDILAGLGARRRPGLLLVGFAAETAGPGAGPTHLRDYARQKLAAKNIDLVVANDVAAPGVGFAHDTNAVLILGSNGDLTDVPLASKADVARAVVDAIVRLRERKITPEEETR